MKLVGKSIRRRLQLWHGLLLLLLLTALSTRFYFVAHENHSSLAVVIHILAAVGVVFMIGLIGGWWLSMRAVQPIQAISDTARKIASGNLAERINVSSTDTELGQLAGVLNTCFDQVQASVNELQAALDRQVQFTADASHELRTPVSVVLAEADAALAFERTPAEYQEALETCRQAALRVRRLTESLLMLARLDSGEQPAKREPCQLEFVTRDAVELLRPLADARGIKLHTDLGSGPCLGDSEQLGQVVTNLVSNAIQYNQPGGEVRVDVRSDGQTTMLAVNDTGLGIPPENLPHIFERFYRADKSRSHADGHVGLGLAITKAIVEAHDGTIQVSSEIRKGSAFTVRLACENLSQSKSLDGRFQNNA